jgi:replicative DNA helicase
MSTALSLVPAPSSAEGSVKLAPHNLELERAVLGVILVHNEAFDRVSDVLQPEHFYEGVHRRIFEVVTTLLRAGKIATPITLKMFLGDVDLGGMSVAQYLGRLAAEATTVINAVEYARTVRDLALRRNLILVGEEISSVAFDSPADMTPRHQIEDAERKLYGLAEQGRFEGGFQRFDEALAHAVDMAAKAYQRDGHLSGMATGLTDLDRMMGGLQRSDLVILAGRPGMGKSALASNIAFNIAKAYRAEVTADGRREALDGGIVGFFSLEMSAEQLATRIIAEQSGVPSYKIRRGDVQAHEFERVVEASRQMQTVPFTSTRPEASPSPSSPPAPAA